MFYGILITFLFLHHFPIHFLILCTILTQQICYCQLLELFYFFSFFFFFLLASAVTSLPGQASWKRFEVLP
jgi:hypothetical protein